MADAESTRIPAPDATVEPRNPYHPGSDLADLLAKRVAWWRKEKAKGNRAATNYCARVLALTLERHVDELVAAIEQRGAE